MNDNLDYEKNTRLAYNTAKAESYNQQQTVGISWIRFTTWREINFVERALKKCELKKNNKILDIPCGTGILGIILNRLPSLIIASDISREMMELARKDYASTNFGGFVRSDITKVPFRKEAFDCVITLGLMHRLPEDIRKQALQNITYLSNKYLIISYTIDSFIQRIKKRLLKVLRSNYQSAPSPASLKSIIEELNINGLIVIKKYTVMPILSAEVVFLLEKIYK